MLAVFSLLLSAISEAFRRPSWKLFVVFVGRLGSFSPFSSAVLEASVCRSCCFVVGRFLAALVNALAVFLLFLAVLLAVLVACSSHSFLAKTFSGFLFLIGALVNIQSSASSKHTVKRYICSTVKVRLKYAPTTAGTETFLCPLLYIHNIYNIYIIYDWHERSERDTIRGVQVRAGAVYIL